ncbi:MAG: DUF3604 domain-containing protein [Acidimicrobiales bacterium]
MINECEGHDHRLEAYAASDRRLLDLVRSFNDRLLEAAEKGADLSKVVAALDPDPARYTWVDEGGGMVEEVLAEAEAELASAPLLAGFRLLSSSTLPTGLPAARPAVACAPDGSSLVAWIEWKDGVGERVMAVALDKGGRPLGEPQPVSGAPGDCLRPSVALDGDGRRWVFFGLRRDGEVGVFAARSEGEVFGRAELVSTTSSPSFNQEVACSDDGGIECCWQGYDNGRFRIYSRRLGAGGRFGETEVLSEEAERNVWDPTICGDGQGRTCYGWTTYGEGGYKTALMSKDRAGRHLRRVLSVPGSYLLHPSVAFDAGGALLCAFDSVAVRGHAGSGPTRLRARADMALSPETGRRPDGRAVPGDLAPDVVAEVVVARLEELDGPIESTGTVGAGAQVSPAGLPRIVCTNDGSVAVAYRRLRRLPLMLYFWETVLEWRSESGWGHLSTFDHSDGPLEEPAVASSGAEALVCWQEDGRKERALEWTEGFGGEECLARREHYGEAVWHSLHTGGNIRRGSVAAPVADRHSPGSEAGPVRVMPGQHRPGAPQDARPWKRARGPVRQERYQAALGPSSYGLYWGDLHRHSLISRCTAGDEPELDDFYRYSFDVCEYDFWAVTDHAENTSSYQWWAIKKLADVLYVKDRFVPFYGFEWTAATGHQNVIYESTRRDAPIYSSTAERSSTPAELWAHLRRANQRSLTIPHHPGSAMVPFDWSYHDEEMLRLVEVFQACRGNYEEDGCFRQYSDGTLTGTFVGDGLRAGHRFGLIASSDHGNGASYVGAFATELSREAIFEALQARRTIAATTRDVVIDLRLNDSFMGEEAAPAEVANLAVVARGYSDIARVDVVRNGEVVHSLHRQPELAPGELALPVRVEWSTGAATYSDWTGHLELAPGRVLDTSYWSPEIVDVDRGRVAWSAETRNFRSQYGAQRGGVEMTLIGAPDAVVRVSTASLDGSSTLGELAASDRIELACGEAGTLSVRRGTGGLSSLGTDKVTTSFDDAVDSPRWYYARVILEDGEMAWSSPIWISPS